ncbi:S41 family peptidase [Bacteroides thetaiotaomicron]|uniref:S41 family peptidase n=1 Tax=Bacteroides thetaiotaomicron TaxID=818 RepID=UPI0039B668C6
MKSILILILLLCLPYIHAQEDQLLTPEQLKEDADYYFKTLYTNHPNPYYYYSLKEFEDKKNDIYAQLNKPLTHEQFAWIIGEINSYIDAHSKIYIYLQTFWRKQIDIDKKIFPVVRIKNDKVYLKENNAEINEINGIKADTILHEFKKYFNWKLPYEINRHWMEAYFSSFLINKYNIEAPFKVRLDSSSSDQVLDGYSLYKFNQESAVGIRGGEISLFKIYPFNSIAIFRIDGFQDGGKEALESALKVFFKGVNNMNIQNIFYDLSMNAGGSFDALYSALKALDIIRHDTITFRLNETKRIDQVNKKYNPNKRILQPNITDENIPKERKLFVLQGINTASAGDYFCRIVAENKLGTLVGQHSGEPTVAFTRNFGYTMPNSKINFSVATSLFDFSDYFKEETLHPDVYWDVNHTKEFTEQELINIIEHCKKIEQQKN